MINDQFSINLEIGYRLFGRLWGQSRVDVPPYRGKFALDVGPYERCVRYRILPEEADGLNRGAQYTGAEVADPSRERAGREKGMQVYDAVLVRERIRRAYVIGGLFRVVVLRGLEAVGDLGDTVLPAVEDSLGEHRQLAAAADKGSELPDVRLEVFYCERVE